MKDSPANKLLLTILAALVFFTALGRKDIVTSHEARVAQTARVMWNAGWWFDASLVTVPRAVLVEQAGKKQLRASSDGATVTVNPWLIPVINGQVRLNKPPLPYWCAAISYHLFGYGQWQARLPSALAGFAGTLFISGIATRLFGSRAGMVAAMVWITSHFVVDEFRKSMADPYLAFFTLVAVWGFLRGRAWGALVMYVALALGALSKGPVILLTVLPAILALRTIAGKSLRASLLSHIIGLLAFAAITVPWPALVLRTVPNALDLWRYEALESEEKARPWYSYLPFLFQMALPWTILFVVSVARALDMGRARSRKRLALLVWLSVLVLAFSIKPVKKNAYLLPAAPAMTLLVASELCVLVASARRARFRYAPGTVAVTQALIGTGFAVGMIAHTLRRDSSETLVLVVSVVALLASLVPLIPIACRNPARWLVTQTIGYALLMTGFVGYSRAMDENRRTAREFAASVESVMNRTNLPLLLRALPEDVSVYLPLALPDGNNASAVLVVLDDPRNRITTNPRWADDYFDGSEVLDCRRIAVDGENDRWRLYRVVVDRNPG